MAVSAKGTRSAGFILAAVSFLAPFVTVSCPGAQFSFSGTQMTFGTTVNEPQLFGPPKPRQVPGEPLAGIAAGSAVMGALIGFADGVGARVLSCGLAVAGGASLLTLKNRIDTQAQNQTFGLMRVQYEVGYWTALIGYGVALLLNVVLAAARGAPDARAEPALAGVLAGVSPSDLVASPAAAFVEHPSPVLEAPQVLASTSPTPRIKHFCSNCGTKLEGIGVAFCENCGTRL